MGKGKNVLTTGDVAKICNVAPRTVSKWFDTGQLKGYRIPGSKDRRIPLNELIRFMKVHNMPTESIGAGKLRILIIDSSTPAQALKNALLSAADYDIQTVSSNFQTGLTVQKFNPHVILINLMDPNINASEICKNIRQNEDLQTIKIIAVTNKLSAHESAALLTKGFDGCVTLPLNTAEVIKKIEEVTAIIY